MRDRAVALVVPLRVPHVRRLWAAQLISEVGDWSARLALALLVLARTHSPAAVGLVTAASMIGWFGPGQLIAAATERWPRRRVMLVADVLRAAAFALAVLPMPLLALVGVVAVAGCATPPFEAARSALRAAVTPRELLSATLTVGGISGDAAMLLGYLVGGGLVAAVGSVTALLVNAATFLVSAVLVMRLPRREPARTVPRRRLRVAAGLLTRTPLLRRSLGLVLVTQGAAAGVLALVAPYAVQVAHAGAGRAAALSAAAGLATLALTAVLPHAGSADALLRRCAWLTLLPAAATVAAFTVLPAAGGFVAFAAAGTLMVCIVPANVAVAPALPDGIRSSAFSLLAGTTVGIQAAGAALAGALAGAVGVPAAGAVVAVPAVLAGVFAVTRPVRLTGTDEPAGADLAADADLAAVGEPQ